MSTHLQAQKICQRHPRVTSQEFRGDTTLTVPADEFYEVMRYAKEACGFDMLICVSSVDKLSADLDYRFEANYYLTQAETGVNLLVRVELPEESPKVDSVVALWSSADWLEREQYDLMGIEFVGHPDLRRILMWDGYPYSPLHKDFPVEGKPVDMDGLTFADVAPTMGAPFITKPGRTSGEREPSQRGSVEP